MQQQLLQEVIVPMDLSINLLSTQEIDDEVVAFDGGNKDNPPLRPPDGLIWQCISINDGRHIYVDDETDPDRGLTFARANNALSFIQFPCSIFDGYHR
jgi:hypothetical protein